MDNLDTKKATNSCLALKSPTLSKANIAPGKNGAWETTFLLGPGGELLVFREGILGVNIVFSPDTNDST